MTRIALFAYGSLVSPASAERTLGRPVTMSPPLRLAGWRRRWSVARDNLATEKTFARAGDGTLPRYCLGLNLEPAPEQPADPGPNGVLIELSETELERLDIRELRYRRVEITADVADAEASAATEVIADLDRIYTFRGKPEHHAPTPPQDAVVISSYLRAVESAFESLGPGQLEAFRATTDPPPVEVIDAVLVHDRIPAGNPRDW